MKITIQDNQHFILSSRDTKIFSKFKFTRWSRSFSKRQHKYIELKQDIAMYDRINKHTLKFRNGYIFYVLNRCIDYLDPENVKEIIARFRSNLAEGFDYDCMYDYQREDLNKLLKFKYGTFQTYTSYGKSMIIALMVRNFIAKGLTVLVIAPSNHAREEIRKRIEKYGTPVSTFVKKGPINVINPKALVGSNQWENLRKNDFKWFRSVDVVISDEVEMTVNPSWDRIRKRLTKAEYFYGFSATANKASIDPIPRDKSLRIMMNDQIAGIVANYGFTAVYRLPTKNKLTITTLHTNLAGVKWVKKSKSRSKYHKIVDNMFNYDKFHRCIKYILDRVDNLYIPINNLDAIHSLVHSNLTDRLVMTIQGSGYHIYRSGKHVGDTNLEGAKKLVAEGKIHAVFGTSSSFRALDFIRLSNIVNTYGKATSVTVQYVGRVAREINMNIWYIASDVKIPIYSQTIENNRHQMEEFYQNCDIQYREEFLI